GGGGVSAAGAPGAPARPPRPRPAPPTAVRTGAPGTVAMFSGATIPDSNWTSAISVGCDSSTWYHIPDFCGSPDVHGCMPKPFGAIAELWLAVAFHDRSRTMRRGSVDSSSGTGHGVLRAAVAWRTRATSVGKIGAAWLPNELRTYVAIAATHASLFWPIETITSG